jgi:transposase InsO family protein
MSISELSQLYGVSRRIVYKWIDRYLKYGPDGLHDRSRKPVHSPRHTAEHIVSALLEARTRHPSWGPKKLLPLLAKRYPIAELPARTTAFEILGRHGMIAKKRQRRSIGHPGKPTTAILAPNDLWCADIKGHFKTGDGRYCYPLTITDAHSRFLLACQVVRDGKGSKDRVVTMPDEMIAPLRRHLLARRTTFERDRAAGYAAAFLPHALSRKYPNAAFEWDWQYVFAAAQHSIDPRSGE